MPFKPLLNPKPIFIFYINIILIISLIFAAYFSIDQSVIISRSGLFNSIHDFLTYSRISVDKNLSRLIDPFNNLDTVTTCYIGIVPILLIFKFWNCKNCLFNVSLITSLCILWLSCGGVFSLICYFFPGMALYRHISFMIPLASFYLVISSSHAMEQFNSYNTCLQISNEDQKFFVNTICLLMIMDVFLTFIIY